MKQKGKTSKRARTKATRAATKDLKPRKGAAAKGGATSTSRFDPYKNFKF